jgi:hypothetical protein
MKVGDCDMPESVLNALKEKSDWNMNILAGSTR